MPLTCNWESDSAEETRSIAKQIARLAKPGDIFALSGDLAAGKTTFIQGFCHVWGVKVPVTSPTFTLINEYPGRIPIYHMDCYRLSGPQDMQSLGYEEYFYGEGIVLIEWADRIEKILPEYVISLQFHHIFHRNISRKISIKIPENRGELCISSQ